MEFRLPDLLTRKSVPVPTGPGWAIGVILLALGGWTLTANILPFLAVTDPVGGEIIVVEGWLPDYAVEEAVQQFRTGSYRAIVATGTQLETGAYLSEYRTTAELCAATIMATGVAPDSVVAVAVSVRPRRDRTAASAGAFAAWLRERHPDVRSVDVVSLGAHARRSRLQFQRAAGDSICVGVFAVPDRDYDPDRWWEYSAGVRQVLEEGIAYVLALPRRQR
jgi:hypothetical protein